MEREHDCPAEKERKGTATPDFGLARFFYGDVDRGGLRTSRCSDAVCGENCGGALRQKEPLDGLAAQKVVLSWRSNRRLGNGLYS
jgi:hypothetical protein